MLRFLSILFVASAAVGAAACLDQSADLGADQLAATRDGCVCPANYDPVCGADGQTYSNGCAASCAGASVTHVGECETQTPDDGDTCQCISTYEPVCGANGHTYSNGCAAGCAQVEVVHAGECGIVGDDCGGLLGRTCVEGNKCRYAESTYDEAPHPDAMGSCVAETYCDAASECDGFPNAAVPGHWGCGNHTCGWETRPGWFAVPGWRFSSGRPYANSTSVTKELVLPAGAARARLVNLGAFSLERGYDTLEVFTARKGRWVRVATFSGTVAPSAALELVGTRHLLRFTSDESVSAQGFDLVAELSWN